MPAEPADPAASPAPPLFSEQVGGVIREILDGPPPGGPPYTHTFRLPPTEYDEDGEPIRPRVTPTFTVTFVGAGATQVVQSRQHYLLRARAAGFSDDVANQALEEVIQELQRVPCAADPCAIALRRLGDSSRPPEHLRETARQVLAASGSSLHPEVVDSQARVLQRLLLSWAELHRLHRACFCHSKPFPAARDYRRRTKHRNRRR